MRHTHGATSVFAAHVLALLSDVPLRTTLGGCWYCDGEHLGEDRLRGGGRVGARDPSALPKDGAPSRARRALAPRAWRLSPRRPPSSVTPRPSPPRASPWARPPLARGARKPPVPTDARSTTPRWSRAAPSPWTTSARGGAPGNSEDAIIAAKAKAKGGAAAATGSAESYGAGSIQVLKGLEPVRKRPGCTSATPAPRASTTWSGRCSTTASTRFRRATPRASPSPSNPTDTSASRTTVEASRRTSTQPRARARSRRCSRCCTRAVSSAATRAGTT